MQLRQAVWAAPLLGLFECGPITVPLSTTPSNTCTMPPGCTGADVRCEATASGSACLSTLSVPESYVLVVNVPEGPGYAPGQVFALTQDDVNCGHGAECQAPGCMTTMGVPALSRCLQLPALDTESGAYVAMAAAGSSESTFLGNPSSAPTTVPVQASYAPRWSLVSPACEPQGCHPVIEASLLNLPLPTVFADALAMIPSNAGIAAMAMNGPEGSPWVGWTALLPSLPSTYVQIVDPTVQLQGDFPPSIQASSEMSGSSTFGPVAFTMGSNATTVTISPASAVEGWTAFFRNRTTRRVVSSQPVVKNGSAPIELIGGQTPDGNDIVLSPPKGAVGIPEFADSYIGQPETYPTLPSPVTVTGTVRSPSGEPVSATIHFVSTALYNFPPNAASPETTCTLGDVNASLLHYDEVVSTADRLSPAGAKGNYSVKLPQGQYAITVDPDLASGFAKEQIQTSLDASSGIVLPRGTGERCTKTDESYDISLEPTLGVAGTVSIADGRPLANATVQLSPAASLLTPQPMLLPWPSQLAQVDEPRPFEVVTGVDGSFSASVDPGAYDVTVRPVDGTRLPWIVSPNHAFSASHTVLEHLYVPAPALLRVTLHEPLALFDEIPVQQAVVRAYAFTTCTPPPGGTCNGVALQIGQALTDTSGSLEMFLTPVPFTPENL